MSTKKRPSDGELRGMLLEGHFGQSRELPSADPVAPTHMHIEIDRIKPYERNPRRQRNPMYAQIKASIRAKGGLDDPIGITRRPGDDLYTVRAGGNTRLTILKELWEEIGDPAFRRAYCLFVPWTSESDCITAHLIENELRGELVFIDKAVALKELMAQLDAESRTTLSRNEFLRRLGEIGYPISKRQMIRYEYAADVLDPLIPGALAEGLGGRQIDEIRQAEQHYRQYWDLCRLKEDFDALFRSTLAEHDSDGWSLQIALDDLEMRISAATAKPINIVRLEIDAVKAGTLPPSLTENPVPDAPEAPDSSPDSMQESEPVLARNKAAPPPATTEPVDPELEEYPSERTENTTLESDCRGTSSPSTDTATPFSHGYGDSGGSVVQVPDPAPGQSNRNISQTPQEEDETADALDPFLSEELNAARRKLPPPKDLQSLRSRCYVLATRFAKTFHCDALIQPARQGHGFFVEIPDRPIQNEGDAAWWGWWTLFSLSEQAISKPRLALAPKAMKLPRLLMEDRLEEAFETTGQPPDAIHTMGHVFLTSPTLSERGFQDLLLLIESCRTLRSRFREGELWQCQTIEQLKKQGEET